MKDADVRFHKEWLGLAQPIEGLVFSVPAMADAQIAPKVRAGLTAELDAHVVDTEHGAALRDVRGFFEAFLGYSQPGRLVGRDALPADLSFYAPEGRQEIRPSFAIARGPFEESADDPFAEFDTAAAAAEPRQASEVASPFVALVWDLSTDAGEAALGIELDKSETETGPWRYPPTAKLERLLRHTGIPIGFLSNRRELRLVYAPAGEASAHLTFRFKDLAERAGRPLVAALELIFHATRTYGAAPEFTFEGLLRESRQRQADVTKDLAAQVFEAVEILLEGFEHAAARDCVGDRPDWLRAAIEEPDDHLYEGILSVVLRLVFTLYAEDQSLVPVQHRTYAEHLSVLGLYERLADDAGAHPESMHLRFGAYGRLISLFRAMFLGVQHGDLRLPPRRGRLFDPSAFPFLEGGLPGWTAAISLPEERAAVQLPSVDDDTVYRVLHRLVVFKGQRLSYRSLDVEQIGAVYESLMGYHVLRVLSPAVRLGKLRVWAESDALLAMKSSDRKKFWKETCGLSTSAQKKAEAAVKGAEDAAAVAEALVELAPGGKSQKRRHRVGAGRLVLQPGEERRRTGSHYTPRWLSEKVVRRTLEPILACLGENRTADQILTLKICDPAMGSGAFLVAACRILAEEVVAAWDRAGEAAALTEEHGDALLHARRLVAQRCLYGVDKNAAAVELAKLSLWLVTLSRQLPFTFVDHALRHGDSLVGLDLEQIRSFHWKPEAQIPLCRRALDDALEQALEHRGEILALAECDDPGSQREKQRLLEYAEQATARVRMIADACVGAFFAHAKDKAREKERVERLGLVTQMLGGDDGARSEVEALAGRTAARRAPFHWMIEFPEVFYEMRRDPLAPGESDDVAYMEAFVGNPPFLRGAAVSSIHGNEYRDWLLEIHPVSNGGADLCAHFFLRAAHLLGSHGCTGMIATNTISQGVTRTSGLAHLVDSGFSIYDAWTKLPWRGGPNIAVAVAHLAKGTPAAHVTECRLDGQLVPCVSSRFRGMPERGDATKLKSNAGLSYKGAVVLGDGFILSPEERDRLVEMDPANEKRIFPYLGGKELNTSPTQAPRDFIINFEAMKRAEADRWPSLLARVEELVKPQRERLRDNADGRRRKEYWWQFGRWTPGLKEALSGLSRCLVAARVTKHLCFSFQPTDVVFTDMVYVFPLDAYAAFAVLQSRVHLAWVRLLSSTLADRAATERIVYGATECFETFPFPSESPRELSSPEVEEVAERLYIARAGYMRDVGQGFTGTYNRLLDPSCADEQVEALRRLHEAMDRSVLDAYGWTDIAVPPFCPRVDADLMAIRRFEDEVVDRLCLLNGSRTRAEQRLGRAPNKKSTGKRGREGTRSGAAGGGRASRKQGDLF